MVRLFLHPDAVEEGAGADDIRVRESCRAWLSDDVGGERKERWLRSQVGAALGEVIQTAHALPTHDQARLSGDGAEQAQHGKCVGWVGANALLLPVVQTVTVRVGAIRRAIGGQTVLLQPCVGDEGLRRLELV